MSARWKTSACIGSVTAGTRTATDASLAGCIHGVASGNRKYDENDKYAVRAPTANFSAELKDNVKGVRLGIVEDFTYRNVDPEVARAVEDAVEKFTKLGAVVKTIKIPL